MVEPITTGALVAGALSTGAAILAKGMLSAAAKDAYIKLKSAISSWAKNDVESLEKQPEFTARETLLATLVDQRNEKERDELANLAKALIAELGNAGKQRADKRITVIAIDGGMAAGRDQTFNYAPSAKSEDENGS